ncbi:MAG TPA: rhomboid family intramembrane serine protease [Gemmatimonadales bacterium]|nr:rhomboid family intramembrane serine protease [Gemmatimonadales bacterium]
MNLSPSNRLTPWVGRLIIANAVVLLLLMTVFTAPALQDALRFAPGEALRRPWTFVTYMFVHAGLLHLLGNMLMLYVFGSPVEHRLGGRAFILYYLYCGIGAAVLSLALSGVMPTGAIVGASGAVLGVGVAFALLWPDAELLVFPLPMPIKARTLILVLIGLDIVMSQLTPNDGVAHLAHIGGAMFGYLFFRLQALSRRSPHPPPRAVERVVMVQSGGAEPEQRHTPPAPIRPRRRAEADPVAAEVDRVLDKISEQGIASLTPAERRFLDEVSRQKKQEH